jgi:3-dehydroquinate synthase
MSCSTVTVGLGTQSYQVTIGAGALQADIPWMTSALAGRRCIPIIDETVFALHGETVLRRFSDGGILLDRPVLVPSGERAKDFAEFGRLLDQVLSRGIDRRTVLIAIGGGVTGDLVGFAAATLLRGIDFIQIPTTLLAQIDSSVGGKTGINTAFGKNLVGAFHQPIRVCCDIGFLDTLSPRDLRAGYAEMVKYGLIDDPDFFDWLEKNGPALLAGNADLRADAIHHCVAAKARVVAADEKETGPRALLNLGHTFGHALEAEAGYTGTLLHGEAVAIGTIMAFDLSVRLGLCPAADAVRIRQHFLATDLPVDAKSFGFDPARLLAHMGKDKKAVGGTLVLILARGIGGCFIARDVAADDVLAVVQAG